MHLNILSLFTVASAFRIPFQRVPNESVINLGKRGSIFPAYSNGYDFRFSLKVGGNSIPILINFNYGDSVFFEEDVDCIDLEPSGDVSETDSSMCGNSGFVNTDSDLFKKIEDLGTFKVTYNSLEVETFYYASDNLTIEDFEFVDVNIDNFTFVLFDSAVQSMHLHSPTNYLGLGFSSNELSRTNKTIAYDFFPPDEINDVDSSTQLYKGKYVVEKNGKEYDNFLQTVKNQGIISKLLYSLYFDDDSYGQLLLGVNSTELYEGEATTFNLKNFRESEGFDSPSLLGLDVEAIRFGKDLVNVSGIPAYISPTSEAFMFPADAFDKFKLAVDGDDLLQEFLTVKCDNKVFDDFPFSFTIEGVSVPINFTHLVIGTLGEKNDCYINIIKLDHLLLGYPFIQDFYTVYNLEDATFSYADRKPGVDMEVISTFEGLTKTRTRKSTSSGASATDSSTASSGATDASVTSSATEFSAGSTSSEISDAENDSDNEETSSGSGSIHQPSAYLAVLMALFSYL